ncbi:MAG: helix-turn-helix transcriptional regulator [Desulfurococcaceae archaeon]
MSSRELTETQLRIYLYILTHGGDVSVREIARDLRLSPSTVHYSLKRLEELGYVTRSSSGYVVKKPVKLEGYVLLGRLLVPRLLVYGLFFSGVFTGVLIYTLTRGLTGERLLALVVSLVASTLFYYEAFRAWRRVLT